MASLNVYSVIGLMIAAMHFASLLLLANKMLTICSCKLQIGQANSDIYYCQYADILWFIPASLQI